MQHDERVRDEAVAWAVRTGDPGFADWEAFTAWLERSPDHARAYDRVATAVAEAAERLPVAPKAANDDSARAGMSRRWFGGAVAASLVALMVLVVWQAGGSQVVETRPGETRLIALEDGGRIDLEGGTRIELDRDDPRFARLEYGRALFTIEHDEADPFRLEAGEATLLDAGTVFDVALDETVLSVAVAEGAVVFNPRRQAVELAPGDMLRNKRGSADYDVLRIAPDQVGEWREGRLTFHSASMAEVAADLTRATGIEFSAAPGGNAQISGSILVAPVRENPRAAGEMLGLAVRPRGESWVLDVR